MISTLSKFFIPFLFFMFSLCYVKTLDAAPARVAIVIDDIGYRDTDKQALTLPGAVTYSFLPHTPYGKKLALQAKAQHKDVLLHIPMEAENGKKLGPGALTSTMNETQFIESLQTSLAEIPFAIGINNHMGSHLTQLDNPMIWTMSFLKQHNLLFLDSKTSPNSKAGNIAKSLGVPVKRRHIFLDNQLTPAYINKQFQLLVQYAKNQESTIAIAHPHPETVLALKKLIPTLAQNNIQLVPLSTLYVSPAVTQTLTTISD